MCDVTIKNETKDFFVFSYFNIVPEGIFDSKKEKNDEKFKNFGSYEKYVAYQCAYRAYLDVCRTIKYSVSSTTIYKNKNSIEEYNDYIKLKEAFIDYEIKLILTQLNNIQSTKEDFDEWHNSLCKEMLIDNNNFKQTLNIDTDIELLFKANKNGKDETSFKYGMAQKWVNMTIKNLILAEDMFEGCTGYGDILENKRNYFHVPVDKNILKAAKNDLEIKKINNNTYSIEGWSNWIESTYTEFIKLLREKLKTQPY